MNGKIHTIGRTSSTQHIARRLIEQGLASMGDAVIADEQTAGQGRFGRSWISPSGGMYATIILSSDPLLSLKAGLALVCVLRRAGVSAASLKWPNDVLVEDRKIAGVLIETAGEHSLVGIGLNLTATPLDCSTCVSHYVDVISRDDWALSIISEISRQALISLDMDAYREACLTLGRPVRLERLGQQPDVEGIAVDVDEHGRLVVMTAEGKRTVSSGECFHAKASEKDG